MSTGILADAWRDVVPGTYSSSLLSVCLYRDVIRPPLAVYLLFQWLHAVQCLGLFSSHKSWTKQLPGGWGEPKRTVYLRDLRIITLYIRTYIIDSFDWYGLKLWLDSISMRCSTLRVKSMLQFKSSSCNSWVAQCFQKREKSSSASWIPSGGTNTAIPKYSTWCQHSQVDRNRSDQAEHTPSEWMRSFVSVDWEFSYFQN